MLCNSITEEDIQLFDMINWSAIHGSGGYTTNGSYCEKKPRIEFYLYNI